MKHPSTLLAVALAGACALAQNPSTEKAAMSEPAALAGFENPKPERTQP